MVKKKKAKSLALKQDQTLVFQEKSSTVIKQLKQQLKIDAALDKVRSRALAMHRSNEIKDVVFSLFNQLKQLDVYVDSVNVLTYDDLNRTVDVWVANPMNYTTRFKTPYIGFFNKDFLIARQQQKTFVKESDFEAKNKGWSELFAKSDFRSIPEPRKKLLLKTECFYTVIASRKRTGIQLCRYKKVSFSSDEVAITERFSHVFEQAYTRFLDLQKAEAQAREAQIEAALERVRAAAMAMHNSKDLSRTAGLVLKELRKLDIKPDRFAVGLLEPGSRKAQSYSFISYPDSLEFIGYINVKGHFVLEKFYNALRKRQDIFIQLKGRQYRSYYEAIAPGLNLPPFPLSLLNQDQFAHLFYISVGYLIAWGKKPYEEFEVKIIKRFASVLDLTLRRYQELIKAEAQTKEALIEAALERVRAASMAMHDSNELNQLIGKIFIELTRLDMVLTRAALYLIEPNSKSTRWWMANSEAPNNPMNYLIQYHTLPPYQAWLKAWQKREVKWQYALSGKTKKVWDKFLFNKTELSQLPAFIIKAMKEPDQVIITASFNNFGSLSLATLSPLPDDQVDILVRFSKVFEQTYTRFRDLQKAEAQAREAQIEASLEKLRARAAGMHSSAELTEASDVLFDELKKLEINVFRTGIGIIDSKTNTVGIWSRVWEKERVINQVPINIHPVFENMVKAWKKKKPYFFSDLKGQEVKEYQRRLEVQLSYPRQKKYSKRIIIYTFFFSAGALNVMAHDPLSEDVCKVLLRFATAFGQMYTRFLDLQKAEAQAREAEIQLALERVRARTMAMQKSEELSDVVKVFYEQIRPIGIAKWGCTLMIFNELEQSIENWFSGKVQSSLPECYYWRGWENNVIRDMWSHWKRQEPIFTIHLKDKEKYKFDIHLQTKTDYANLPEVVKKGMINEPVVYFTCATMKHGMIHADDLEPIPEENKLVLKRFAKVFEQSYTRFLDLQKAEAQAREAKIEVSLERVRAKTMAMHNSRDVGDTVATLYQELVSLELQSFRLGIIIFYEDGLSDLWTIKVKSNGEIDIVIGQLDTRIHPMLQIIFKAWKNKESALTYELKGRDLKKYYTAINNYPNYPVRIEIDSLPEIQFNRLSFFSDGGLFAFTQAPIPEEKAQILNRFASVFGQTYRRYRDLQKAEAQAREAQIEAALERVRAASMAMHKSEELQGAINAIIGNLKDLSVEVGTANILIYKYDPKRIEYWTATNTNVNYHEGLIVPYSNIPYTKGLHDARANKQDLFSMSLSKKKKNELYKYLFTETDFKVVPEERKKFLLESEAAEIVVALEGSIGIQIIRYVSKPFSQEDIAILHRFTKVFKQTYTRFLDLQKAEAQAREAQIEAATERVRAQSMAMHHTHDLSKINKEILTQLNWLQVSGLSGVTFYMIDENGWVKAWDFSSPGKMGDPNSYTLQYDPHQYKVLGEPIKLLMESDRTYLVADFPLEKLQRAVYELEEIQPTVADVFKEALANGILTHQWSICAKISNGILGVDLVNPPNEDIKTIVIKMAGAFNQAYTRFLDLQKAEAQARESQIQLALERVRARTMAMQSSEELAEVSFLLNKQVVELGIPTRGCAFNIYGEYDSTEWFSNLEGTLPTYKTPREKVFLKYYEAGQQGETLLIEEYSGKKIKDHYKYLLKAGIFGNNETEETIKAITPEIQIDHVAYFKYGYLLFITLVPAPDAHDVFKRFAKEFEQTYTRFLDLQKAEAQAREAQIEAALERVRSRSLAMHKSDELFEVVSTVFERLKELNLQIDAAAIFIFKEDIYEYWFATAESTYPTSKHLPHRGAVILDDITSARELNRDFIEMQFSFEQKNKFFDYIFEYTDFKLIPNERKKFLLECEGMAISVAIEKNSGIQLNNYSGKKLSETDNNILKRFGRVFEQAYTRFLDLQKAEAQTREAEIELALERIRARTMAIQKSSELSDVISVVFEQLSTLGFTSEGCDIIIYDKEKLDAHYWFAGFEEGSDPQSYLVPYHDHPYFQSQINGWKNGEKYKAIVFEGELKKKFDDHVFTKTGFKNFPKSRIKKLKSLQYAVVHDAFMSHGIVETIDLKQISNEKADVLQRIAKVFDQTYTRFLDLQKAESQARQAQIELGLERVRARAMAMKKSEELTELISTVFTELTKLDFALTRTMLWFFDEHQYTYEVWMANSETDKTPGSLKMPIEHPFHKRLFEKWKERKTKWVYELKGEEKKELDDYLFTKTVAANLPEEVKAGIRAPERIINSFSFHNFGGLLADGLEELTEDNLEILYRFSKEFDITYTRFLDLQKAEAQAREAQIEVALERVRASMMAMHHSEGLPEVMKVIAEQFIHLGIRMDAVTFSPMDEKKDLMFWTATTERTYPVQLVAPYIDHPLFNQIYEGKTKGHDFITINLSKEDRDAWWDHFFTNTNAGPLVPEHRKQYIYRTSGYASSMAFKKSSTLNIVNYAGFPFSEEENSILKRFSNVFDQSYIRFLDLQKAEAQAREAQIEAALERVRARTMAMHKSVELSDAASELFKQVKELGFKPYVCAFIIIDKETSIGKIWMTDADGNVISKPGTIPTFKGEQHFETVFAKWESGESFYSYHIKDDALLTMDKWVMENTSIPLPDVYQQSNIKPPTELYFFLPIFKNGYLLMSSLGAFTTEEQSIYLRFTQVFQQTYTRFLDLQKAEAQAREAQIQLALERVRARTMAMHRSSELSEVSELLYKELQSLGLTSFINCGYVQIDEAAHFQNAWMTNADGTGVNMVKLPLTGDKVFDERYDAWKRKEKLFHQLVGGDLLKEHIEFGTQHYRTTEIDEMVRARFVDPTIFYCSNFSHGYLHIVTNALLSEEDESLLVRFTQVFEMTYKRFLDLQNAEAQAREAQIEAALERVRSRSLAMHKSEEMQEVVAVVFGQLQQIGLDFEVVTIATRIETSNDLQVWVANPENSYSTRFYIPFIDFSITQDLLEAMDNKVPYFSKTYSFEEKNRWWNHAFAHTDFKYIPDQRKQYILSSPTFAQSVAIVNRILFQLISYSGKVTTDQEAEVVKRFARVFEQCYIRFQDLQKAEAQAREAQIEAALERVRSRTMAMHNSEELREVVHVLFEQLQPFGISKWGFQLRIAREDKSGFYAWLSTPAQRVLPERYEIPTLDHWSLKKYWQLYENQIPYDTIEVKGDDKLKLDLLIFEKSDLRKLPEEVKKNILSHDYVLFSVASMKYGLLEAIDVENIGDEEVDILKRFAKVFEQTYTRFLDLTKAEAQAREAQIEAALERVRAKAMAMHNSDDLSTTASIAFTELKKLGIDAIRFGVGILDKVTRKAQLYSATFTPEGGNLSLLGWALLSGHRVLDGIYDCLVNVVDYFPEMEGDELRSYYEKLSAGLTIPGAPVSQNFPKHFGHFLPFGSGGMYAWAERRYTDDEVRVLKRFSTTIDLTFRRYFELQQSEANEREAIKRAALDRVRAEIASMRTKQDLDRITPLIWKELTTLGIPFVRCGVFIMDEANQKIHTFLSTPDGKSIAAFHLPFNTSGKTGDIFKHWAKRENYINHWNKTDFSELGDTLVKQGALPSKEMYLKTIPDEGIVLHCLSFLQGMLYVGNIKELQESDIHLIQSVADAFSTAYARYEDFNKLEVAKIQVDKTLVDLKQAQQQLVQSEKMASLGELTAGIAHEIQNPLNFVNNFSEVNKELLLEMEEAIQKGDYEEAKSIAKDIRGNQEKINLHGKRAEGIVKGMLQHSRGSSGQKELTDINDLCDEYLRLSYHGYRAKDKSFNAKFKLDLDPTLPKISVVPQDIGRVVLNLINNAFYTVSERANLPTEQASGQQREKNNEPYQPQVTVSTKSLGDKIEIRVRDNGIGISDSIKEKIFQPFFTTKPTGQGTGLGLSLSYDIVKAHGGELKADSKINEGTSFIIQLPAP